MRVGSVSIDATGYPRVYTQDRYSMSKICETHKADDFFDNIAEALVPHMEFSKKIGISFAYPGVITVDRDMIVESMCKEVVIDDICAKSIRQNLLSALERKGIYGCSIYCTNDTVASLLGAAGISDLNEYEACVGLILGTGTNTAFKLKMDEGYDIINSESGMFALTGGKIDETVDMKSTLPSDHLFEKKISGKYLPELLYECMVQARIDGLISEKCEKYCEWISGDELSTILSSEYNDIEMSFMKDVATDLARRAAMLTAANIASWIIMSSNESQKALIVIEGSTVEKLYGFKEIMNSELKRILVLERHMSYNIVSVDDAVVKGAAVCALI